MKCRLLRRRYLLLRSDANIDDSAIISAVCQAVSPKSPLKIIGRQGLFVILRTDNRTLESMKLSLGRHFTLSCGGIELQPVFATGTLRKAREKIKKSRISLGVGDEEAVPVKQNSKDVDKMTD